MFCNTACLREPRRQIVIDFFVQVQKDFTFIFLTAKFDIAADLQFVKEWIYHLHICHARYTLLQEITNVPKNRSIYARVPLETAIAEHWRNRHNKQVTRAGQIKMPCRFVHPHMRETFDFIHFGESFQNQAFIVFDANTTVSVIQILRNAHTHLVIGFTEFTTKRFFELVDT